MNSFWNERFSSEEYAYGEEPNLFFKQEIDKLSPGKLLMPGEGEGRNAVYAAAQGWDVTAFDPSSEGKKKALRLAEKHHVKFKYELESYESVNFPQEYFDCIGLVYTHMDPKKRAEWHKKLIGFLKPGGTLILEAFAKEQINRDTGGPRNVEVLFSEDELANDFESLAELNIREMDITFSEGPFHQGVASVIRVVAKK